MFQDYKFLTTFYFCTVSKCFTWL